MADEEDLPFDRQVNEQLRGVSRCRSLEIILGKRQVSPEQFEEMTERKNRYYQEMLEQMSPADVLPGALDLLREVRAAGVKVAIASASKNARTVVEHLNLTDFMDVLVDGYSVERAKPAPDLFLFSAQQLGVPPAQCVVVEDAAAG
jgi:kojibiose phosphorylase